MTYMECLLHYLNYPMNKTSLWQFFTVDSIWLRKHIKDFIIKSSVSIAFDPFAGWWDLLNVAKGLWFKSIMGYDIDPDLKWEINDSLINIPKIKNSIIITNPPYLSNYSAKRKWVLSYVEKYFNTSKYDDLYKIALEKCIESNTKVVAIVPETFINSDFPKSKLHSITILEDNPFWDTENPVCVVCFDWIDKSFDKILVYKTDNFIGTLDFFENLRLTPTNNIKLSFNRIDWEIALRAVDMPNPNKKIEFMIKNKLEYDLKWIKESSRLITIIKIWDNVKNMDKYLQLCNQNLFYFREKCDDILLSPFKWNDKLWKRRRRLDYKTARAIMEKSFFELNSSFTLFNI